MTIRETIANSFIGIGRSIGNSLGLQMAVELSDHSIDLQMEQPDKNARAWDSNLYRKGNVFVDGYSNPIKPRVNYNEDLENPNTIDVTEGNGESEEIVADGGEHVQLISSGRYRDYMRQDLISQLLTPDAQWKLLAWGVLALAVLQFLGIIITLYATGQF